jgi:serine/threonine-protein kinase
MFAKSQDMTSLGKILRNELTLPSAIDPSFAKWDAVVRKASTARREERYQTARAMAIEVEKVCGIASAVEMADWVEQNVGPQLKERAMRVAEIESGRAQINRQEIEAALRNELSGEGSARSERTAGSKVSHAIDIPSSARLAGETIDPADVDFRPKSKARVIVPLVLFATVVIGGAIVYVKQNDHVAATPPPPPPATTTTTVAPQATATETSVVVPIAVKPPTTTAEEAPPPPQPSASEKSKASSKTNAKLPPPPPVKPNCDTPYTIDAQGHKHFRTECL